MMTSNNFADKGRRQDFDLKGETFSKKIFNKIFLKNFWKIYIKFAQKFKKFSKNFSIILNSLRKFTENLKNVL